MFLKYDILTCVGTVDHPFPFLNTFWESKLIVAVICLGRIVNLMFENVYDSYEPRHEKTGFFAYAKTKTQISFAVTAKLISAFVFTIRIVQSLYFLNPKFQASRHLLWLCSPVCVGPGRKPRRPVFSGRGSYVY